MIARTHPNTLPNAFQNAIMILPTKPHRMGAQVLLGKLKSVSRSVTSNSLHSHGSGIIQYLFYLCLAYFTEHNVKLCVHTTFYLSIHLLIDTCLSGLYLWLL